MRRTFSQRAFSKLGRGSLRGSIFSLCAAAIGGGILSLPYVLRICGYVQGILILALGAFSAYWSMHIIVDLAITHSLPNYSEIAYKAGGHQLCKLLEIFIILLMFGSCVSFQIICTSLIQYVFAEFGLEHDIVRSFWFTVWVGLLIALLILLPLSLKRDMHAFRYVSLLSILALAYTAIVMIIKVPSYYRQNI